MDILGVESFPTRHNRAEGIQSFRDDDFPHHLAQERTVLDRQVVVHPQEVGLANLDSAHPNGNAAQLGREDRLWEPQQVPLCRKPV